MTTEFYSDFASIHNDAIACGDDFEKLEHYRQRVKYKVIPSLVENYKLNHPEISWGDAYLAVRKAHIEYIGTLFPREGITAQPFPEFESKQTPVLDRNGQFHCCYRRDEIGLPAFRHHTLTFNGKELISWYHHSSPVPYEIQDSRKRLEVTIKNLQQLPGKTIAEIRLLSPMRGLKERFSAPFVNKYFTTLNDHDQLLETAIAAELCNKEILLFNLGVNFGRKHASSLQKKLNIRALKKLLAKLTGYAAPANFTLSIDDQNIKKTFLAALIEQNPEDYADLPQDIESSKATEEEKILYKDIMALLSTGKWIEHNFQVQAKLVRLNYLLGHTVATGCNDAKDRDGELTNVIEAQAISTVISNLTATEILSTVREHSTAKLAAEAVSMPSFAKGLDIEGHPNRRIPKTFKLIYTAHQHEEYKKRDKHTATAHIQTPILTENPLADSHKQSFWTVVGECFSGIGKRIKKLGSGITTLFWSLLLTVGLITAASASTDLTKDGASSADTVSFNITLPSDGTSPPPQPFEKRKEETTSDDFSSDNEEEVALEEEDYYSPTSASPHTSPSLTRKIKEDDSSVKTWKEARSSGSRMSTIETIEKMGLIGKSPSGGTPLSLSKFAEENQGKIRRFTF